MSAWDLLRFSFWPATLCAVTCNVWRKGRGEQFRKLDWGGKFNHGPEYAVEMGMRNVITALLFFILPGLAATGQSKLVKVERHDSVTVYYPQFTRIDLVTGSMPPKTDEAVIFVCAAAFTGQKLAAFSHSNIAGHHVSGGEFFEGYRCGPNNGIFTWSKKGRWHFYNYSHKNSEGVLRTAAREGGMGFGQSLLFHNGKQFKGCFKPWNSNQYRALCEIDGKLCIVDCARTLPFGSFLSALKKLGVTNAIYCDMGYGWNYSWYRQDSGRVQELFLTPGKYTTNWIAFYAE